jgi:shikimate kinase
MMPNTISLIGMPGAGKSTVGVLLAKELGLNFVDTDLVIQVRAGETLQHILDQRGYLALRELEQQVLNDIPLANTLVSTGGSAIYSETGIQRLRAAGPTVFLDVSLAILAQRVDNEDARGIARSPGQDFADVFAERHPLYLRHADLVMDGSTGSAEAIARDLARQLGS